MFLLKRANFINERLRGIEVCLLTRNQTNCWCSCQVGFLVQLWVFVSCAFCSLKITINILKLRVQVRVAVGMFMCVDFIGV